MSLLFALAGPWVPNLAAVRAAAVVVTNRTNGTVEFRLRAAHGPYADPDFQAKSGPRPFNDYKLVSGEVRPIAVLGPVELEFPSLAGAKHYLLEPNTVSYFGEFANGVDLEQVSFTGGEETVPDAPLAEMLEGIPPGYDVEFNRRAALAPLAVIPVKILVDDNEAARQEIWQQRLTRRLEIASQILARACRVRFKVVAFDRWETTDKVTDFVELLGEFEHRVDPGPAKVAIGFASQFEQPDGPTKLGGVRGPFRRHCLVREWPNKIVTEAERLEVLVHELAHLLCATHSPEPDSVMRPILGDGRARARNFRIQIDPANALILHLVGEELRVRNIYGLSELSTTTKLQLARIYAELEKVLPNDPAASQFRDFVRFSLAQSTRREEVVLLEATRRVLTAVTEVLQSTAPPPATEAGAATEAALANGPAGDALTSRLVRTAARAARGTPPQIQRLALFLGLALALDDTNSLAGVAELRKIAETIDDEGSRRVRSSYLSRATMLDRTDLVSEFFFAAALTAALGPTQGENLGLVRLTSPAREAQGFSFAQYAAQRAGGHLAKFLAEQSPEHWGWLDRFAVADVMPRIDELPEKVTPSDFDARYGGPSDARFQEVRQRIDVRIGLLPAYRSEAAAD
ncbi:MAG: hypothetical protein K1X74_14935 [Pirellulales bacterium]|nr:hypothetical protein [Pirellulales bacterium]